MPTLELPNLAAYSYQKRATPPPIATPGQPIGPTSSTTPITSATYTTSCQPGLQLCVEQGATLNSQIALIVKATDGTIQPVDITGAEFEFTAKTDPSVPDEDPSVIEIDWSETVTPKQGTTWLTVPASVTATMLPVAYFYQVRMVQSPTSPTPIVTPLFSGTLTIVQPVSARYQ